MKLHFLGVGDFDVLETNEAVSWSDAMALAAVANEQQAGGFSDWVLPELEALKALKCHDENEEGWFWSSSICTVSSNDAWMIHFRYGYHSSVRKTNRYQARLVRAGQVKDLLGGVSGESDSADTGMEGSRQVEIVGMVAGVAKIAIVLPDYSYDIIGEVKINSRKSVKIGDMVTVAPCGEIWQLVC